MDGEPSQLRDQDIQPELYQYLVESADVMLYIIGAEGCYRSVNEKFVELTGYTRDELIGATPQKVLSEEDYQHVYSQLMQVVNDRDRSSSSCTATLQTKSGNEIPIRITFTILPMRDGEYRGMVGVARDIREAVHRQQKLDVLGRVLRHDFRNKINIISGIADILRRGFEQDELTKEDVVEYTTKIESNANRMMSLTEKSRRIQSEIRVGHVTDYSTDLHRCVVEAARAFKDKHGDVADITIEGEMNVSIEAPEETHLVIFELIENAFIHVDTDNPSIKITVSTDDGGRAVLRVHDECPEFPDVLRPTLDNIEQPKLEHQNGLGLWLVNWFASTLNADFRIESGSDLGGNTAQLKFNSAERAG